MRLTLTLVATLVMLWLSAPSAHADMATPGETFDFSGTAIQTSGANCCSSGSFIGMFMIGSEIASTNDWTVTEFSFSGCRLGADSCSSAVWSFAGLEFDASNDTLLNTTPAFVSAPFTGNGGDSRLLEISFVDGNTTDSYSNFDTSRTGNDKFGTITYSIAPVPEPSSVLLLSLGLGLTGWSAARRKVARHIASRRSASPRFRL